jgi:hypothetical protein
MTVLKAFIQLHRRNERKRALKRRFIPVYLLENESDRETITPTPPFSIMHHL